MARRQGPAALLALLLSVAAAAGPRTREGSRSVELRDLDRPEVARIGFLHTAHKPFGNDKLRAAMRTRVGERFQSRFFRSDLTALENLFRGAGYMSVNIARKSFALDRDGHLEIDLEIDSGALWHVEAVEMEVPPGAGDAGPLRDLLRVRPGEPFLYGDVLEDERQLLTVLNRQGYAHARVHNRLALDAERGRAAVVYEVDPGRRMYFGPIRLVPRGAVGGEASLHTRPGLIGRYLTFEEGQLYDPEQLRRSRNQLSRTGLFRSVALAAPEVTGGDSIQPVEVLLQERKFIHLEANAFLNNTQPGVSANVQHGNWMGRGMRLGLDASAGQPLQGATVYMTERDAMSTGADLTLSAGISDEWSSRRVYADPDDSLQFALLTRNYSILNEMLLFTGADATAVTIAEMEYDYPSVERLIEVAGTLDRRWERGVGTAYEVTLAASWRQARNRPESGRTIATGLEDEALGGAGGPPDSTGGFVDDPFGDSLFDDDPFDNGADGGVLPADVVGVAGSGATGFPYDERGIDVNAAWLRILTDRSKTLNFTLAVQRDTRDSPIAPSRGTLARAAGLYAIQFGGQSTRVLEGDGEVRHYLPLGRGLVWAQAGRLLATASLRRDRALPQSYWQLLGGEGSVRGVERDGIQAVGGGRFSVNVRNELRARAGAFGAVLFWDRGGVWRHGGDAHWSGMIDGYGAGLRYDMGIPFRLDVGWSKDPRSPYGYFSIGQAF